MTGATTGAAPAGIDRDRLDPWLARAVPGLGPVRSYELITGGRSNLTFRVVGAGGRAVLRRPPLGPHLPTAHDVGREARVLAALAPTAVPVPAVLATCDDPAVTGAPFFVMEEVAGVACRDPEAAAALDPADRRRAGPALVEALAALHALDPARVGLGDLARPGSYAARQLKRWRAQLDGDPRPAPPELARVADRLAAALPDQDRTTLVHGDPRLDNCLLGPGGEVAAVVDWELAAVGDPRADVGLLLAYWAEPGDAATALQRPPTVAGGFATRAELVERYLEAGGQPLDHLGFFVALALWKLACIVHGVHGRLLDGALGDQGVEAERFGRQVVALAAMAAEAADDVAAEAAGDVAAEAAGDLDGGTASERRL